MAGPGASAPAGKRALSGVRGLAVLFAALGVVLLGGHVIFGGVFSGLREKTFDTYQSLSPIELDTGRVAVIAIDEASLARYGRWPWPRELVGRIVDAATANGALAVGLDLFFAEPDAGAGGAESDAALAEALARGPAVLAMSLDPAAGPLGIDEKAGWTVVGLDPAAAQAVPGGIAPLPAFAEAAKGLGVVRTLPDGDGVIRKVPLIWAEGEGGQVRLWPALSLELLRVAQEAPSYTLRLEGLPSDAIRTGEATVPLGEDGRIRIIDTTAPVPHVSAERLLEEGAPDDLVQRLVGMVHDPRQQVVEDMLAVGDALDVVAQQRIDMVDHQVAHAVEIGHRAVMGENPASVLEGMRVLQRGAADGRLADMGDHGVGIDAGRRLAKMLAMPGRPGLFLDHRHGVAIVGHPPAMAVHQPLGVALALLHQGVLRMHEAAFDPGGFVGAHCIEAAHWRVSDSVQPIQI